MLISSLRHKLLVGVCPNGIAIFPASSFDAPPPVDVKMQVYSSISPVSAARAVTSYESIQRPSQSHIPLINAILSSLLNLGLS